MKAKRILALALCMIIVAGLIPVTSVTALEDEISLTRVIETHKVVTDQAECIVAVDIYVTDFDGINDAFTDCSIKLWFDTRLILEDIKLNNAHSFGLTQRNYITFDYSTRTPCKSDAILARLYFRLPKNLVVGDKYTFSFVDDASSFKNNGTPVSIKTTNGDIKVVYGSTVGGDICFDYADDVTYSEGVYTVPSCSTTRELWMKNDGEVTSSDRIVFTNADTDTVNITLNDVLINTSSGNPIDFGNVNANLTLLGNNDLTSSDNYSAIRTSTGRTLTIDGTGSLTCNASQLGAGIGGNGTPVPLQYAEDGGNFILNSGTVNVTSKNGAGIGGGGGHFSGSGGSVLVKGGTLNVKSVGDGAGIGGGSGQIGGNCTEYEQRDGTVTVEAKYGAGIGGGKSYSGSHCGPISIYGGTLTAISEYGAGIGGGIGEAVGGTCYSSICIFDGKVTAKSKYGAGIGGGYGKKGGSGAYVYVAGGDIYAESDMAAGIGGAIGTETSGVGGEVVILGGKVVAVSRNGSAVGAGGSTDDTGAGTIDITRYIKVALGNSSSQIDENIEIITSKENIAVRANGYHYFESKYEDNTSFTLIDGAKEAYRYFFSPLWDTYTITDAPFGDGTAYPNQYVVATIHPKSAEGVTFVGEPVFSGDAFTLLTEWKSSISTDTNIAFGLREGLSEGKYSETCTITASDGTEFMFYLKVDVESAPLVSFSSDTDGDNYKAIFTVSDIEHIFPIDFAVFDAEDVNIPVYPKDDDGKTVESEYRNLGTIYTMTVPKSLYHGITKKYVAVIRDHDNPNILERTMFMEFSLTFEKIPGSVTNISDLSKLFDNTPVSAPTYTSLSTGDVTIEYKTRGADDSTYTAEAPRAVGNYTVRVSADADVGYNSSSAEKDFSITYIPTPATPYTLSSEPNTAGWYNGDVTITPAEGYKITESIDGERKDSITVSASAAQAKYRLVNASGQITDEFTVGEIKIDKTAPTITALGDTSTVVTQGRATVSVSTGASGVKSVEVEHDGKTTDITATYADGHIISENGTYLFRLTNGAGVTTESSITFANIDHATPVIALDSHGYKDGTWTKNDVKLTVTNTTANIGRTKLEYKTDEGWTEYTEPIVVAADTNGTEYTFRATSEAGIISSEVKITVRRDTIAPDGEVVIKKNSFRNILDMITFGLFFNDSTDVEIMLSDDGSGIASVEYVRSDKTMTQPELIAATWTPYTKTLTETAVDGERFIYYAKITDNAGNVKAISSYGATFDIEAPVFLGITDGATYCTTQTLTVRDDSPYTLTLNGKNVSVILVEGVVSTEPVTLTGDCDEVYTMTATDYAGNSTTVTVTMKPVASLAESVNDVNKDNVKPSDRDNLAKAKADLEKLLNEEKDSMTEGEKTEINNRIKAIDAAIQTLDNAAAIQEEIDALPAPDKVTKSDADAINAVKVRFDALSAHEKEIVAGIDKLDALIAAMNKTLAEEPGSYGTGDSMGAALTLFLLSGSVLTIMITTKKKRRISNK